MTVIVYSENLKNRILPHTQHLPWNNVGMMFCLGYDYFISFLHESFAERKGHKINGCRRPGSKYYFLSAFCIEKIPYSIPRSLIFIRSHFSKSMHSPMDIGIEFRSEPVPFINDRSRTLTSCSIVKIHKILPIYLRTENRKLLSDISYIHISRTIKNVNLANLRK